MRSIYSEPFCGQVIYRNQISEIAVIVATFPKLSRTELANTICELFSWKRPTGKRKTVECRQFLERLDARGIIRDDDEFAQKKWIEELLYVHDTYNENFSAGPVLPKYQEQPPD